MNTAVILAHATKLLAAQKPHPFLALPSLDQMSAAIGAGQDALDALRELLEMRGDAIKLSLADPLRHGYRLECWERADKLLGNAYDEEAAKWTFGTNREQVSELYILGGNRSSKTEFAAWLVVQTLLAISNSRIWCFQTSEKNSVHMQQERIFDYLPAELKKQSLRSDGTTKIKYSKANGFTNQVMVLPNGSVCEFRNYKQDIETIEGGEIDMAWCDELVPIDWIKGLRARVSTRNGLLLITFTPVKGYTPTVKEVLQGSEVIEETEVALLPAPADIAELCRLEPDTVIVRKPRRYRNGFQLMPLLRKVSFPRTARIIYFHTLENPFHDMARTIRDLEGAPEEVIKVKAYGEPSKPVANAFPKFSNAQVIDSEKFEAVKRATWYHIVDPCSGRNFFMIWLAVLPDRRMLIAREWPQLGDYIPGVGDPGPWAKPSGNKHDGDRGPAQDSFGWGFIRYAEEIRRIELELGQRWGGRQRAAGGSGEGWAPIEIAERIMDSRYASNPTLNRGASTTVLEEFAELTDDDGADCGLDFIPGPGHTIEKGLHAINAALDWDDDKPPGRENQPRLYVHEDCDATRFALGEWTGKDGQKGACKDPIDVIRYGILSELEFIDPDYPRGYRGGVNGCRRQGGRMSTIKA